MLSSIHNGTTWAHQLPPEMRVAASKRMGSWEITTWETSRWFSLPVKTSMRFTELELNNLVATGRQNLACGAKETILRGGLEQTSSRLWKTGSLNDQACRALGPELVLRWLRAGNVPVWSQDYVYLLGSSVTWTLDHIANRYGVGLERPSKLRLCFLLGPTMIASLYLIWRNAMYDDALRTTLHYVGVTPALVGSKNEEGGDGGEALCPDHKDGDKKESVTVSADPTVNTKAESRITPQTAAMASRPQEAEAAVTVVEHGRYRKADVAGVQVHVVVGQDFDKTTQKTRYPDIGVITAPCADLPNVYTNCAANVRSAIDERYTKKAKPCTVTAADKKKIGGMVKAAIGKRGPFNKEKVSAWFAAHFTVVDERSKKWSEERASQVFSALLAQVDPDFKLKTSVKAEHMPEGKAPRFLIADGDAGQVMALMTVKCMEELLFERFEEHSIKHVNKREAVKRLIGHMKVPGAARKLGACFVEGDGSAWDTTCNATIRGLIENPILRHIASCLSEHYIQPQSWEEAHCKLNEKAKLKLFFSKFEETFRVTIDAIRRSGHRGTSVLNWWINFVMWMCSVFAEPERFLDPETRWGVDVGGVNRWLYGAWEGDDSGVSTAPKLCEVSEEDKKLFRAGQLTSAELGTKYSVPSSSIATSIAALEFWNRGGFNMKWVFPKRRGTMVGVHMAMKETGTGHTSVVEPEGAFCPELPRALKGGTSCSVAMLKAVHENDIATVRTISSAAALARAADFAGILPTVSRKYMAYADTLDKTDFVDREMSMRVAGDDGMTAEAVRAEIAVQNSSVTVQDEEDTLRALVYDATVQELEAFCNFPWDFATLDQHDQFADSLPATWAVGGSI